MNYVISEEELKSLFIHHSVYQDNIVNDFIATKQPVELVGEGKIPLKFKYDYLPKNAKYKLWLQKDIKR